MKIAFIVGARPNFMKVAPLIEECARRRISYSLIHTGQHYDKKMSALFFSDLGLPRPDINLNVGKGSYGRQTGRIMEKLEPVLLAGRPDVVVTVGDVNSTLAGALIAKQLGMAVAHVEAGLRSFDRTMPEEINRVVTDHVSDFLFTTEKSANKNLRKEGISKKKIHFVGNVMIDTLLRHKREAELSSILSSLSLEKRRYAVVTLHRPSNVDSKKGIENVMAILGDIQRKIPVVFPLHPRTRKNLKRFGMLGRIKKMKQLIITDPLGYVDFLNLMANSRLVLTDSGGIQDETTILGIPCITLRENTERPVTLTRGTNLIVSIHRDKVAKSLVSILGKRKRRMRIPPLWDGKAAARIITILLTSKRS